jgi:hypothetical protein
MGRFRRSRTMHTYVFEGNLVHSYKELGEGDIEQLAPRLRQVCSTVAGGNRAASIHLFDDLSMYAVEEPRYLGRFMYGGKFA